MSAAARRVLVTGGTSGLGLAMASALAAAGATVALTGRSAAQAARVAEELPGAVGIELDVRDESSVARWCRRAMCPKACGCSTRP
jgi:NAD(P)-dependent dehydrogenase (short-subunit alcohol dehydrogenase family)